MKVIITKICYSPSMDGNNTAYITDCTEKEFESIAKEFTEKFNATVYSVEGISMYRFYYDDPVNKGRYFGSISMTPYRNQYAIRIIANINSYYSLNKKQYDETIAGFIDELPEENIRISGNILYADDEHYINYLIKLQ